MDTTRRCLYRTVIPAKTTSSPWTWPAANGTSSCIARGDIGSPLFTYYGIAADGSISATAIPTASVPSSLASIASVAISMSISDTANPNVAPTLLQDQVTLINVQNDLVN